MRAPNWFKLAATSWLVLLVGAWAAACSVRLPVSGDGDTSSVPADPLLERLASTKATWGAQETDRLCARVARVRDVAHAVVRMFHDSLSVRVPDVPPTLQTAEQRNARAVRRRVVLLFEFCGAQFRDALPLAIELLRMHVLRGEYVGSRRRLERALASISQDDPTALASEARASADIGVRLACIRALGHLRLGADEAAGELRTLAGDPSPDVAIEAFLSIERLDRVDAALIAQLQRVLSGVEDESVRDRMVKLHATWSRRLVNDRK